MIVKCVVAGVKIGGGPDFYFCKVECTQNEFDNDDHHDIAESAAEEMFDRYGQMVTFDEHDGPAWLFEHFVWESASVVHADGAEDEY